jgi:glucose/arabinose dehydrogenase
MTSPPRLTLLAAIGLATLLGSPEDRGREAALAAPSPARLTLVGGGLRAPVALVGGPKPGSPLLYVAEQSGRIRVLSRGRVLPTPFLDLRSRVAGGGLRGLLSFVFHPAYLRNGRFYVLHVGREGDVHVAEYRARSGVGLPGSRRELLVVRPHDRRPYSHYGGQLAFGPDGLLYASFGDGGRPASAQDAAALTGKLVRLDVSAREPKPEVVALGLRNPWRFSFHRGSILVGDAGETKREEIDVLPAAFFGRANFGWDFAEGTVRRRAVPADVVGRVLGPALEYPHATRGRCYSVIGGYVYRGSVAAMRGRYLFGDLCGGIWSARPLGNRLVDRRSEAIAIGGTLSSFGEDARGELYAVGYSSGAIYRLTG